MSQGKGKASKARGGAKAAGDGLAGGLDDFDIDAAQLPPGFEEMALRAGGYPYAEEMKRKDYDDLLEPLQIELIKLQADFAASGRRLVVVFEGRDSAGKGGAIKAFMEHLNPRHARAVALARPSDVERGQWYFQRYVSHLPTRGDIVLFDRSWYNRAGVERVMGFANADEVADFLREAPAFEGMLVRDGIHLVKFFLTIGRHTQLLRFHERRHDPLKRWKLSDMDLAAIGKWDAYTAAIEDMFRFTHTPSSPWTVIKANDQRRARLEAIRFVLSGFDYEGKDARVVGAVDTSILGSGAAFFYGEASGSHR